MNETKKSVATRESGGAMGDRARSRKREEDPAALLAQVLAISGADLDPDQVEVVIHHVRPLAKDRRWTWFLELADGGLGHVSAIRSDDPEGDGWTAPEVNRAHTLIGLVRAADPAHGARFLRFLVEVTAASHVQTADGRPILNVTPPGPLATDVRIALILLAAGVLALRDQKLDPAYGLETDNAALSVHCGGHFVPGLERDAEPIGLGQLPDLYLLWCLDSAWGPIAWCAAARGDLPPVGTRARLGLEMSGYDLAALARGELPREVELARSGDASFGARGGEETLS